MRRSPIVIAATVAGTAGVLAFHPQTRAVQRAAASATTPTPTPTATRSSSSASASGSGNGTATGDAIDTQYGSAQVRVTVKNGKIVTLEALQLQNRDPHSQQISSSAAPILQQEILTSRARTSMP